MAALETPPDGPLDARERALWMLKRSWPGYETGVTGDGLWLAVSATERHPEPLQAGSAAELDAAIRADCERRLAAYKAAGVVFDAGGHFPGHEDWWQARIPLPDGEQVVTALTRAGLLDKLDELSGGAPDAPDTG